MEQIININDSYISNNNKKIIISILKNRPELYDQYIFLKNSNSAELIEILNNSLNYSNMYLKDHNLLPTNILYIYMICYILESRRGDPLINHVI